MWQESRVAAPASHTAHYACTGRPADEPAVLRTTRALRRHGWLEWRAPYLPQKLPVPLDQSLNPTTCLIHGPVRRTMPNSIRMHSPVFTARRYASAVIAVVVCPSVRLCVRLSVTSRYCIKTATDRITQTTPHDSPGNLVFWCQKSFRNSNGFTPNGGAKWRWGRLK